MKAISIKSAEYIECLKVKLYFSDNTTRVVDFYDWLNKHPHPQYNKYKSEQDFKKFKIEQGNIVWGKNWDLIFPVYDLYKGKLN